MRSWRVRVRSGSTSVSYPLVFAVVGGGLRPFPGIQPISSQPKIGCGLVIVGDYSGAVRDVVDRDVYHGMVGIADVDFRKCGVLVGDECPG